MYIYRNSFLLHSTAGAKGSIDEATEDESGRGRLYIHIYNNIYITMYVYIYVWMSPLFFAAFNRRSQRVHRRSNGG